MFQEGNCGGEVGQSTISKECKPDPERMLQNARRQGEAARVHIEALLAMAMDKTVTFRDNDGALVRALGSLVIRERIFQTEEVFWLKEIDKP